jgi:SAM-dependent methyltransferase
MSNLVDELLDDLRAAYGAKVTERADKTISPWKVPVRAGFLQRLQQVGGTRLLEIGAGTGVHGSFFAEQGLEVVCTDLSPQMVEHCRSNGLTAHEMNFSELDFPPRSFDAVFAMNCLLHVPRADLPAVLASVARVLDAGGLFFWGQYGGHTHAGTWPEDRYEPKRFFSLLTDDDIRAVAGDVFDLLDFEVVPIADNGPSHFQALTLKQR